MVIGKKIIFVGILSVFVVLVASSFVTAGFGDWFKNVVTGKATTGAEDLNLTIGNNAPRIIAVFPNTPIVPTENTVSIFKVNFTVEDPNGAFQIDNTTAIVTANFSGSFFPDRFNATCSTDGEPYAINFQNFTCDVEMQFFDNATLYGVNVTISDTLGASAENFTTTFTYNQLTAFVLAPDALTFPGIDVESVQTQSDNDPTLMNNTGNDDIAVGSIDVTAINLLGESIPSETIFAENFTINVADACSGTAMVNETATAVAGALMRNGNHSANDGTAGQEELFYCLEALNNDLSAQSYSTANAGAWTVLIS